jgi:homoserine kinase type II
LSVYTKVGHEALAAWLQPLALGKLLEHAGIAAGMQNSNYFVTTESGRFVLTLFEALSPQQLDFYLALMAHLGQKGVPCPQPLADAAGRRWRLLQGKPAALLTCLRGREIDPPEVAHCHALGRQLAELHVAGMDFPCALPNPCGAEWRQKTGEKLLPLLAADEHALLADELAQQALADFSALPSGIIHADLFRDNVLWDESGCLTGVLDFYFAGVDSLLFDLAVAANDWCQDERQLSALIDGYASIRPLTTAEGLAWPMMQRAAALRFWLLRLEAKHQPKAGDVVTIKNPEYFRVRLQQLRLAADALAR